MASSTLVLNLVSPQLARISEATAAEAATVGLDVSVLEHVALQVAGLCKALLANVAFVRPCALVGQ